jgi:hypothetical protein
MATFATVSTVRATFGNIFFPVVMGGTSSPVTGTTVNLNEIHKVAFGHKFIFDFP